MKDLKITENEPYTTHLPDVVTVQDIKVALLRLGEQLNLPNDYFVLLFSSLSLTQMLLTKKLENEDRYTIVSTMSAALYDLIKSVPEDTDNIKEIKEHLDAVCNLAPAVVWHMAGVD